jgi:excisionase family DNA binding protein
MTNNDSLKPHFFTIAEMADELRVSKPTLMQYVHSGKLPTVMIGKQYRIARYDFDAFLAKQRKTAQMVDEIKQFGRPQYRGVETRETR